MKTLVVGLDKRAYPIHVGQGLLAREELFAPAFRGSQVMVVTNETISPFYLSRLELTLRKVKGISQVDRVLLPDGEVYKTFAMVERIIDALLETQHNRRTTLVALGGGVIGDMTGSRQPVTRRGVPLYRYQQRYWRKWTPPLAEDGVNHPRGKNMIGAFHQPACVVIDVDTLTTLPEREFRAGLAEVIKYGLIRDPVFFAWLEQNMHALLTRDKNLLTETITRSCANKAGIVEADEREEGVPCDPNLGHTFGHAIEAGVGYGVWLHGEAVAAGMVMAMDLSVRLGLMDDDQRIRGIRLIEEAGLPLRPPPMDVEKFLEYMQVDKKNVNGRVRLVLLRDIGEAFVTDEFPHDMLRQTLIDCLGEG